MLHKGWGVPLSEDEQRILQEIERNFYTSDPSFATKVSSQSLFRSATRLCKWSALGFFVGLGILLFSFTISIPLGFVGFLIMLFSSFVFERNFRKLGRVGWQETSQALRSRGVKSIFNSKGKEIKSRFRRQ